MEYILQLQTAKQCCKSGQGRVMLQDYITVQSIEEYSRLKTMIVIGEWLPQGMVAQGDCTL